MRQYCVSLGASSVNNETPCLFFKANTQRKNFINITFSVFYTKLYFQARELLGLRPQHSTLWEKF